MLSAEDRRRRDEAELRGFLSRCGLPPYPALQPPRRELAQLREWLGFEEAGGQHPLTAFLKLNPGDARTLRTWLLDGTPVGDWHSALRLAKVLRNSTVHGSLSATKVCRWGLRPAFQTLTSDIGGLVAAAVGVLAD